MQGKKAKLAKGRKKPHISGILVNMSLSGDNKSNLQLAVVLGMCTTVLFQTLVIVHEFKDVCFFLVTDLESLQAA